MSLLHLLPFALLLLDFFLELFLNLHEDAVSFALAVSCRLGNAVEGSVQLVAQSDESFGNLSLLVEAKEAFVTRVVVDHGVDEILTVAFVQEHFDLFLGVVVGNELQQLAELHSLIVVLALLQDTNSQGLCDEWLVLSETRIGLAKSVQSGFTFPGDDEGGVFLLNEIVKLTNVLICYAVNVFHGNVVDDGLTSRITLNLQHAGHLELFLAGHDVGLIEVLHTSGQVAERETLEVVDLAVEWDRESGEDELVIDDLLSLNCVVLE